MTDIRTSPSGPLREALGDTPTWAQVLAVGAISGGVNPTISDGDALDFDGGSGASLSSDAGGLDISVNGAVRATVETAGVLLSVAALHFGETVAAPNITQDITAGAGEDLTIAAQSTSSNGVQAGHLNLSSGNGEIGEGIGMGQVRLQLGGTTHITLRRTTNDTILEFSPGAGSGNDSEIRTTNTAGANLGLTPPDGGAIVLRRGTNGNVAIGAPVSSYQSMVGGVYIQNATAVPTGNPLVGGFLYTTGGALTYRGSGGTTTTVAPA